MERKTKFYLVDDDPLILNLFSRYLEAPGREILTNSDSVAALNEIILERPDCVILDNMMPGLDGMSMLKRLRQEPALEATKIIMVSAKSYEFDQKRAMSFGADGYIVKPVTQAAFVERVERILADDIRVVCWGVHGTLPVPGERTVKYGGNTTSVSVEFSKGNLFIFDAGTGIRELSQALMARRRSMNKAKIFLSHPHWDHINAIPFFVPLYLPGNEFEILGPQHGDISTRDMVSAQMEGVYFPVNIKEFSAGITFRNLGEESFTIDDIHMQTMLLNHPGYCLGYRISYRGRLICYVTDNELYPADSQFYDDSYRRRLIEFIRGADILLTDATYMDHEYPGKIGWGHSAITEVVDLANDAEVKKVLLIHHDPSHGDREIEAKLECGKKRLQELGSETECVAPREQEEFVV